MIFSIVRHPIDTHEPPVSVETSVLVPKAINKRLRIIWSIGQKLIIFIFCLSIFILGLILLKEGAKPLAPLIRDRFSINSPASALGLGWLSASLALSGSPIAATALALLDARVLNPTETFAMISGSRLGASFIVLLLGFFYLLRGKKKEISLGVGLLSLLVTQSIYPLVMLVGFFMLSRGWMQQYQVIATHSLESPLTRLFGPLVTLLQQFLPTWVLFPIGFLLILTSLALFDRALPEPNLEDSKLGQLNRMLYRPLVTFLLGAGITTITMSVSMSISLLVPLSVRGYIRRENIIPYILGANITTFDDTLIAAALLGNQAAITVVLVQLFSVTLVALTVLLLFYRRYERIMEWLVSYIGGNRKRLFLYIMVILGIPFALIIFK